MSLLHTQESPGISPRRLSQKLLCDKSNVSRIIRSLESDKLLERHPHETDRRSFRLYLTDKGTAVCNQVRHDHKLFNIHRLSCLDSMAEGDLLNNLSKLNNFLSENLKDDVYAKNGATS